LPIYELRHFPIRSAEINAMGEPFGRIAMLTHLLDAVLNGPASRYAHERQTAQLKANTEELASLRFSIILTAKWVGLASLDDERRSELRAELEDLRRHYSETIDEIAMTFGVQNAINAKEEVERTVAVPLGMKPPMASSEDDPLYFWAQGMRRGPASEN